MNSNNQVDTVKTDFSTALDKIVHYIILRKITEVRFVEMIQPLYK